MFNFLGNIGQLAKTKLQQIAPSRARQRPGAPPEAAQGVLFAKYVENDVLFSSYLGTYAKSCFQNCQNMVFKISRFPKGHKLPGSNKFLNLSVGMDNINKFLSDSINKFLSDFILCLRREAF